ncbi:hypothetical protein K378_03305 [Streptomyces sp. Amel2xB2]|nr:hypothetical protein [Streptomyces sp. Amel2xB2]RAJ65687.1 hypothetical protein K378_03305 [Streptomyces sp. Amel2xB2]
MTAATPAAAVRTVAAVHRAAHADYGRTHGRSHPRPSQGGKRA